VKAIRYIAFAAGLIVLVGLAIQGKSDQAKPASTTAPTTQPAPAGDPAPLAHATTQPSATSRPAATSQPASQPTTRRFVSADPVRPARPHSYGESIVGAPPCDCPICRQKRADAAGSVVPQGRPGE
jgi:hypothetical protein